MNVRSYQGSARAETVSTPLGVFSASAHRATTSAKKPASVKVRGTGTVAYHSVCSRGPASYRRMQLVETVDSFYLLIAIAMLLRCMVTNSICSSFAMILQSFKFFSE